MKEICIGVCCRDTRYGKRLMEYLNHQKEFPMTAWFFRRGNGSVEEGTGRDVSVPCFI